MMRNARELGKNEQHRLARRSRRYRNRGPEPDRSFLITRAIRTHILVILQTLEGNMNSIVWLVGAVVIVLAVLSFVGIA